MKNSIAMTNQASLEQLAAQIKVEHENVVAAFRSGIDHARLAGIHLLQAKALVPYGSWLSWVDATCGVSARTAQRYMQIAENGGTITANGDDIGVSSALMAMTCRSSPPNTTNVTHLPPALEYYHKEGWIDDDALTHLLGLAADYGDDVVSGLAFSKTSDDWCGDWSMLNAIRPLDCPPLWPLRVSGVAPAGTAAFAAASRVFFDDGRRRERVPQWEVKGFWFASTMIQLANLHPEYADQIAAILHSSLATWREQFRTALGVALGPDFLPEENRDKLRWGYESDLRHAGVLRAIQDMSTNPDAHPGLRQSAQAGLEEIVRLGSYAWPSKYGCLVDVPKVIK